MNDYLSLVIGIVCAAVGGEFFVRGAVGIAHAARISPGIIGATVAAFATSSPELAVSIASAVGDAPQIALGDALGANVLNVALILGIALVIAGIDCPRDSIRRDFPVALLVPVVTAALCLDGQLSRIDGALLLGVFIVWIVFAVLEARRQRSAAAHVLGSRKQGRAALECIVGFVLLAGAGHFIVSGAKTIAGSFGIDEFVIGATVVAVGTTVPELATVVISKIRGHDEVGLGTILGSNIFNGLFIVAVAAMITPIAIQWREIAVALLFGFVAVAITYPVRSSFLSSRRGIVLLVLYAVYLTIILQL
jgi:cation:H+ antiporter